MKGTRGKLNEQLFPKPFYVFLVRQTLGENQYEKVMHSLKAKQNGLYHPLQNFCHQRTFQNVLLYYWTL